MNLSTMLRDSAVGAAVGGAAVAVAYELYLDRIHMHPEFRILSGAGLRHTIRRLGLLNIGTRYDVVCGDFDRMKVLNNGPDGYAFTDRLIRTAFDRLRIRWSDRLIIGQGKEGDEFAIIVARSARTNGGDLIPGRTVAKRFRRIAASVPIKESERIRIIRESDQTVFGLSATMAVVSNVHGGGVMSAIVQGLDYVKEIKYTNGGSAIHII